MKTLTADKIVHVMDKNNTPAIAIRSGESIAVETSKPGIPDETFTRDYSVNPFPKRVLSITGPIFVEGAEPGDILKVKFENIELDSMGKMWMGQWMGILKDEVDHCFMRRVEVKDGAVKFNDKISVPTASMVGTIGVAPAGDPVDCVYPGDFGGNMDALNATTGNYLYLPVQVPGALLVVGDVHAAMGYGEVFGTGVEIGSVVTIKVEVIKGRELRHPTIETESSYEIIVSGGDMPELCREAARSAIGFVMERADCSFDEAYALVGQTSNLKILQVVNYSASISMEVPKKILINKEF